MIDHIDGTGASESMPDVIPVLQFLHDLTSIHPLAPAILIHKVLHPGDSVRVIAEAIGASKSLVASAIRTVAKRYNAERLAYGRTYTAAKANDNGARKRKAKRGVYYAG